MVVPRGMTTTTSSLASPLGLSKKLHRSTQLFMSDAAVVVPAPDEDSPKKGFMNKLMAKLPPAAERQKLFPLALMFFCILFNYTILRDTKDVLMITAPKSGAEVIPFIKTYFNLPVAIVSYAYHTVYVSENESIDSSGSCSCRL